MRGYLFNNAREIYIYGHGGIGKSELAKKIATTLNDKFDFYWLPFAGSIKQTILDLKTEPPYSYDHGVKIDSEAIYRWNLNCLRGYGPGTVLIIDNFDFTPEEELNIAYSDSFADLRALDLTILFTCRHRPVQVECSICIDELPNTTLAKIMRSHYSGPIEDGVLQRLLGVANNNTLIISQMAKTLEQSWGEITPESLLSSLEEKHDNSQNNEETISYQEHMYKQIRAIFDISVLSKQALAIMAQAILFPTGGINAAIFLRCHDDISRDKIRLLELNGWLNKLPSNNLIVHPLIQEVCARYLSQKEQACADFLEKYYQEFSLLPTKEWMAQRFQRMTVASNAADRLQDLDGTYAEKAGDLNYQEGMYAAAVQYYQTYWKIYLSIHPDPLPLEALRIMDKIANCAYGMSDYPSAIYYESYGLALVEKEVGTNCVELLPYYINMGNIYRVSGDYDSAYDSYSLAMTLCRENQVDDGINTAALYMNLAKLCIRIGKDEEARQYGKKALRILYHHNEIPKTWLASLLESFAILDSREGNHDNELHHSEQAIKIYEATLGREHPRTAASYNNKASALIQLGQYDKALDCLLPAVHILEETLGPLNVSTATTYHNLARVYQRLNRKDQAVLWCERALTSREKLLGASDPSVIEIHELYDDLIDVRIDPNSQ